MLNRQSPLFREARYLLAEETEIRDPGLYHSVLAAIASGNQTNGGIANYVGRKSADITHPLNVLEDAALITREPDLFRGGKWLYRVSEPLITFYEVVMRPEWFRLEADSRTRSGVTSAPTSSGGSSARTSSRSAGPSSHLPTVSWTAPSVTWGQGW